MSRLRCLRALCVVAALSTVGRGAQGPAGEGPLENDVFLPTSEAAARAFAEGDEALAKDRVAALDAWRRALAESAIGDCVPCTRGTESVERALWRRLRTGGAEVARAWRERFDGAAEHARAAAVSDPLTFARVERGYPSTRAATRAALALHDLAHDEGDPLAAATWLERAGSHADPSDEPLARAIARRTAARPAASTATPDDPWRSTQGFGAVTRIPLEASGPAIPRVDPGVTFLSRGRACIQTSDGLHVLGAGGKARQLSLSVLGREHGWSWPFPFAAEGERWPLLPASDGTRIVLVAGRAAGPRGNALLCLEAIPGLAEPHLVWGYCDAGFFGESAGKHTLEELLGAGLWEFEPGPAIAGSVVVAQMRQWTAEADAQPEVDETAVRSWLVAIDLESGLPRWKRLVAIGASTSGRLQGTRGYARPAEPIALQGGCAFAGTGIGAGVLADVGDGRVITSVECRRAPRRSHTWLLGRPAVARMEGGSTAFVWAPGDSDRLYLVDARPGTPEDAPFLALPAEIGDDEVVLGAAGNRIVLLSRSQARAVVALSTPATGSRATGVALPPGETLAPSALVGGSRAIVASEQRVELFDLDRDLYLLDSIELPGAGSDRPGGLAAVGDQMYVAGSSAVWIVRIR